MPTPRAFMTMLTGLLIQDRTTELQDPARPQLLLSVPAASASWRYSVGNPTAIPSQESHNGS